MVARLDRLPPGARISGDQPRPTRASARSTRQARGEGGRWRCSCGEEFTKYDGKGSAEEHADAAGHHRIDAVL